MSDIYEGHFAGHDKKQLYFQSWKTHQPRGTFVLVHGFAEHINCYQFFVDGMKSMSFDVYGFDQRGHGKSPGQRGHIDRFDSYQNDLICFIDHLLKNEKVATPLVLVAHSMGGLVVANTLLDNPDLKVDFICLSSPLFGFALKIPQLKKTVVQWLGKALPKFSIFNEIPFEDLVRDKQLLPSYKKDFLRHEKITPTTFSCLVEAMERAVAGASKINRPLLIQAAGEDRIVDLNQTKQFYEKLPHPQKKLIVYEKSYHEIFNDLDKDSVFKDLKKHLTEFLF